MPDGLSYGLSHGDDDDDAEEDDIMYQLTIANGITRTFDTVTEAKEYCCERYQDLAWSYCDDGLQMAWFGYEDETVEYPALATIARVVE